LSSIVPKVIGDWYSQSGRGKPENDDFFWIHKLEFSSGKGCWQRNITMDQS